MKFTLIGLAFFLQPVFWLGLLRSYFNYHFRIKRTRYLFNVSIDDDHYELRHFGVNLILFGVGASVFSYLTEIILPLRWLLIYEGLASFCLVVFPWAVWSLVILIAASLATLCLIRSYAVPNQNYLILTGIFLLAGGLFLMLDGGRHNIPQLFKNQRGNRVAGYLFKELTVFPLLVMVPGNDLRRLINFYPTFSVRGHSVALVLLPILISFRFTVFRHLARRLFKRMGYWWLALGIVGIILATVSYVMPVIILPSLIGLLILTVLVWLAFRYLDLKHGDWYSSPVSGVRVSGVESGTPASRMGLKVGDVILKVNHRIINNETEFYEALQAHPTYCRLKIRNQNRRLELAGTAIFMSSPHEIGVILDRDPNPNRLINRKPFYGR